MDEQKVKEKVMKVIEESTETDVNLTEETTLYDEMSLSSMEVYVLLNDLEDTFDIRIPVSKLRKVHTVGELCALVISEIREEII